MKKFILIFKYKKTNQLLELIYENNTTYIKLIPIDCEVEEVNKFISHINNIILVKDNDNGIRSVGKPDECFYCKSKIGEHHKIDCVIIDRKNKYSVIAKGNKVGTLIWVDPISSDKDSCEFHKNGSSWCSSNALDDIVWLNNENAESIIEEIEKLDNELRCSCGLLEFKFEEHLDWPGEDQRFNLIGMQDAI